MNPDPGTDSLDPGEVIRVVRAALDEDFRYGPDVTSAAVLPPGAVASARIVARQDGVLAGLPVVAEVLRCAAPAVVMETCAADGDVITAGAAVAGLRGPLTELLGAERTMLNFLTHMSGVATLTRAWVDAVAGTGALIRDTRKTLPGLRVLEKYAVRRGGGVNHRLGLGDAALVKDNHVAFSAGTGAAYAAVRAAFPDVAIEVECDTVAQVADALAAGARAILLDNMPPAMLSEAVALARGYPDVLLEASGGLTLASAREVALTGVDYLAIGALTHSAPALDLALDVTLDTEVAAQRQR
ncbi:MAG TPA: carboxylating nicotinate-nucleotide diphosphorylase [Streptosporangiaceae bacterium]|nr:carboxylating nicotinate-nucleotide diphosphorylase [Streptosporangiaceae bacterium]